MEPILWLAWLLMLFSAGVSFLFSVAETALFSLGRWQLQHLCEATPRRGQQVTLLLAEPQDLLATMVLGNISAFAVLMAIPTWMSLNSHWPFLPSFFGVLLFIILFCELLPKTLAVRQPDVWSLRVVGPLRLVHRLTLPLRWVSQRINDLLLKPFISKRAETAEPLTDQEYEELLEWAGPFDPEAFDAEQATREMRKVR